MYSRARAFIFKLTATCARAQIITIACLRELTYRDGAHRLMMRGRLSDDRSCLYKCFCSIIYSGIYVPRAFVRQEKPTHLCLPPSPPASSIRRRRGEDGTGGRARRVNSARKRQEIKRQEVINIYRERSHDAKSNTPTGITRHQLFITRS